MPEDLYTQQFPFFCVLCGLYPWMLFADGCRKANCDLKSLENDLKADSGEVKVNLDDHYDKIERSVVMSKFGCQTERFKMSEIGTIQPMCCQTSCRS